MTTTERPERSVPKPVFTDAEAGAREFPDSSASARRYNYFNPAKRKQTHYEDVTVEVQPDPRHYLTQGWIYGFANGETGYPLHWTKLKAWGVDEPEPQRGPGSGGLPVQNWPAHGWHEFRDPNEEWEQTLYRYNANVVRQLNQNVENARNSKAFDMWAPNWVRFVERHVGAWMHIEHILGLYVFGSNERSCPTNMHNTALAANSARKIRFAQDLALYNLTLSEEIEGFDGSAHVDAWNSDSEWQGARKLTEALTAVEDDWGEAMFATNVVFEPLVGELFRSNLVMQSAAPNGDFVTPTVMGAGENDYCPARPAVDDRLLRPARPGQGVRRPQSAAHGRVADQMGAAGAGGGADDAAPVVVGRPQAPALRGQPRQGEEPVRRDLPRSRSRHP